MMTCKLEDKIYKLYAITINDKIYIGLTGKSIKNRLQAHILRCYSSNVKERVSCPKLYNKIRKTFSSKEEAIENCSIVEIVNTKCLHCAKECELYLTVTQYDSVNNGLNSIPGGIYNPSIGKKLSEDHKKKISIGNTGKKHSEKTKKLLSQINLGKKLSQEHIKKLSESHKGQQSAMLGKVHSKLTKDKISKSLTGKIQSEFTKNKRKSSLPKGSSHHNSKLCEDDVRGIKKMIIEGFKLSHIAEKYSIDNSTVSDIKRGKTWGWLS